MITTTSISKEKEKINNIFAVVESPQNFAFDMVVCRIPAARV